MEVLNLSHKKLAVAPPMDEIFKPIQTLKGILFMVTFLGIIILFALYIGKSISRPIVKVTELINETGIMAKSIGKLRMDFSTTSEELQASNIVKELIDV